MSIRIAKLKPKAAEVVTYSRDNLIPIERREAFAAVNLQSVYAAGYLDALNDFVAGMNTMEGRPDMVARNLQIRASEMIAHIKQGANESGLADFKIDI